MLVLNLVVLSYAGNAQHPTDSLLAPKPLRFSVRQLQVPLTLSLMGIISNGNSHESIKNEIKEERNEYLGSFHTKIDNYLQYSPFAIAYGLDAFGIQSKTDLANRTAIMIKGELTMIAVVHGLKKATHQLRPDGSTYNSFPSGHTAQAFAAATFLSEEYKDRFPWMPYASYGLASSVGLLRVANNRHYMSDVLLGAGIGILAMKSAYWMHQYKWNRHTEHHVITY